MIYYQSNVNQNVFAKVWNYSNMFYSVVLSLIPLHPDPAKHLKRCESSLTIHFLAVVVPLSLFGNYSSVSNKVFKVNCVFLVISVRNDSPRNPLVNAWNWDVGGIPKLSWRVVGFYWVPWSSQSIGCDHHGTRSCFLAFPQRKLGPVSPSGALSLLCCSERLPKGWKGPWNGKVVGTLTRNICAGIHCLICSILCNNFWSFSRCLYIILAMAQIQ